MRVLIVNMIPSMRSALKLLLAQFKDIDYIVEVGKGASLEERIISEKPDIMLLDEDFWGKMTKDAIFSIKAKCPDISVVILADIPSSKNKYINVGIGGYVIKGYPPEKLYNCLNSLIKRKKNAKKAK